MSATETRDSSVSKVKEKLPAHQLNPSYTVRVICCVLFIFLTEIFLAHYVYRLINSEIREDYITKDSFERNFLDGIRGEQFRDEVKRIIRDFEFGKSSNNVKGDGNENVRAKRNVKHRVDYNYWSVQAEDPQVRVRDALEDPDRITRKGGEKIDNDNGDWIWVTSSSRIPEKTLEGYCQKVQQFCPKTPGPQGPPGAKGEPGLRGLPGNPGVVGFPGQKGQRGNLGYPGMKGEKGSPGFPGEKGGQGRPGLDGRDGLPGEPGLFGMPGRNGHDGLPGKDGTPGRDGKDGSHGLKGDRGLPGPPGPQGPRGLPGPKGKPGKAGNHGMPGIPGITAWKTSRLDKDNRTMYLIAPSITAPSGPFKAAEGENIRLPCVASGSPTPKTTWQRLDGRPIDRGPWQDVQVTASMLNLTQVNRGDMAVYMCTADNGVPPVANMTYVLEVHFPPLIRISNQTVGVSNGSTAVLECETEAFPEPVRYWVKSDGSLIENNTKYRMMVIEKSGFKSRMVLQIFRMGFEDFNYKYYCVAKNELQKTVGEIQIYEVDPRHVILQFNTDQKQQVYGVLPPPKVSYEELCPPIQCTECDSKEAVKCTVGGVSFIDLISRWEVRPFQENITYPGYPPRTKDCILYAVGKPVYHKFTDQLYGAWMRDPLSRRRKEEEKIWVTYEFKSNILYEYDNKTMYRQNKTSRTYILDHPFGGNTHVMYDGNFYYNVKDTRRIIKYHLETESTVSLDLPIAGSTNSSADKIYTGHYNTVDFSVDDNGLWLIFAVPNSNNTAVMKVNVETMIAQYIWNISIDHNKVGEMFIVCGVLYALDSVTEKVSKIRFAFDLYKDKLLDVNLSFTNPFGKTTMLGYNPKNLELYSWDRGNQLTYPIRYHDIGYNTTSSKDEKSDSSDGR